MRKFSSVLAALLAACALPCSALVFAVNEGATYRVSDADIQQKYKPVADDIKGKKIGIPSPDSITAVLTRTTLRDSSKDANEPVTYVSTRYQDAIPFMVEHGLVDAGVTGSESVAKAWTAAGGKVAFSSKAVPVKLLLAARHVKQDELEAMHNYFITLEQSDKGKRTLETIEKKGFVAFDAEALAAVNRWISIGVK